MISRRSHYESFVVSQQGMRESMEDAHVVVRGFYQSRAVFAGVYDGHNGKEVAEYAQVHLHEYFRAALEKNTTPQAAFQDAYRAVSEAIGVRFPDIGSTAATLYLCGDEIHYAWAGDSRIVVVGKDAVVSLTKDHRANNPSERKRILASGGEIIGSYVMNNKGYGLMVTRSLGDAVFGGVGVTSDPETGTYEILGSDRFVIVACDGLWDVVGTQELPTLISQCKTAKEVVMQLERVALNERKTTDNLTIVVMAL